MDGVRNGTRRHSLPLPVETDKHDHLVPMPLSLWYQPQKSTRDESKSTLGGWYDPLPGIGDLDTNSLEGTSRRQSARSMTSDGDGSTANIHDPRHQSGQWRSSDRFSLGSNVSSSSAFTRFSGSTSSTLHTAPSSNWRHSRGSVLQREKRFSNLKCKPRASFLTNKL
jgi:hypothetical protein